MASVLNRTTKQFIASANTPNYPTASWIHNPDMSAVAGVALREWLIDGDTVRQMTATEKDSNILSVVKTEKMNAIDARTKVLIDAGFEYPSSSGNILSLSLEAQSNIEGIHQAKDAATYPIDWNTKDNAAKVSLADAAAVSALFDAAMAAKRTHLDGGTALKDSVRSATTVAAVDAVTDSR